MTNVAATIKNVSRKVSSEKMIAVYVSGQLVGLVTKIRNTKTEINPYRCLVYTGSASEDSPGLIAFVWDWDEVMNLGQTFTVNDGEYLGDFDKAVEIVASYAPNNEPIV